MEKSIRVNYVDVIGRRMYAAEITFDEQILKIEKVSDGVQKDWMYCVPGLIDAHVHIESSMLVPQMFARMVLERGTVGVVCDPHEIANVMGEEGVRFMMRDAKKSSLKFFFTIPSCVPATPFETNGAEFGPEQIRRLLPEGVALAEMMNYPGLLAHDPKVMEEMAIAREMGKPIDGHIPGITDERLRKYAAEGVSTDHESYTFEEAKAKIRQGMKILVREGSAARNLDALAQLMKSDMDNIMACTDDAHPDDIRARGHIDKFYRRARREKIEVYDIFKMLTLNPIKHYKLDVGRVQVGDKADFVLISDLEKFDVRATYINGNRVFDEEQGVLLRPGRSERLNNFIDRSFTDDDFKVISPEAEVALRVIGLVKDQLVSEEYEWKVSVGKGQEIESDVERDIVKIAVINRYKEAPVVNGFIKGTGLKRGAMASSIAHDSHNVVVIGRDVESMRKAAEIMFGMKGGIVVVEEGGKSSRLQLSVAGLMTSEQWEKVADKYERLVAVAKMRNGVTLTSPFMTMAFMSLLVIPKLKIGDKGLFDVDKFAFTELFKK